MWAAHQLLIHQDNYDIRYYSPYEDFLEGNPDILAVWGGAYAKEVQAVALADHPRKVMFHAGGDMKSGYLQAFNKLFIEWPYEEQELKSKGFNYTVAFGTNEHLFRPIPMQKMWDSVYPCAYADWKRHRLFADAFGERGLVCGSKQKVETYCYEYPEQKGCTVLPNLPMSFLPYIYSAAFCTTVTASYFGGSQRTILESMACGIPAIVMSDAKRNCIYIEESGQGYIVEPEQDAIKEAVLRVKEQKWDPRPYVLSKWTSKHYADAIKKGLQEL